MKETTRRNSGRRLLSVFATALLAAGALVGAPIAANAAEKNVTDGSLTWGIREQWRNYIGVGPGTPGPGAEGEITSNGGATTTEVGVTTWGQGTGTVDAQAGTGTISYQGTMTLHGHPSSQLVTYPGGWGMTQTWSNPQITLTSPTTATLSFEMTQTSVLPTWPTLPNAQNPGPRYSVADLTFAAGDLDDGQVTTTSATLNQTGADIWANYGDYQAGLAMDPVTFSFDAAQAQAAATTTTVAASAATAQVGESVNLTATVAPAQAAGTVTFSANGTKIGDPVAVTNGTATLATTALAAGANAITASFTPTDATAFAASTSTNQTTVTVSEPAVSATATETTLTTSPSGHATEGSDVTLTAKVVVGTAKAPVEGKTAEGTVEFFDGESSLGTAQLADGTASLTLKNLALGGHTLKAVYTSSNGLDASEGTFGRTGHFGVVDANDDPRCIASFDEPTYDGVSATWDWSQYSQQWQKYASGNVKVDGQSFVLSNGRASQGAGCTTISFTGTLRVEAYNNFFPEHGQWVELVDPTLVVDTQGHGAWTAEVRSGANDLNTTTSRRVAVAEIDSVDPLDFTGENLNATVTFKYAGTAVPDSWAAGQDSAWAGVFIMQVPEAIRSFYYSSGAGGDVNKPASPLTISWSAAQESEQTTPTAEATAVPSKTDSTGVKVSAAQNSAETSTGLASTGADGFLLAAAIASVLMLAGAGVLVARRKSAVTND